MNKSYGSHRALSDLTLEVPEGVTYGLLGPNGAGKTTAIYLAASLLKLDSGSISVGGVDVATDPSQSRKMLAYVPERVTLYPYLSGLENLDHFSRLAGIKLDRGQLLDLLGRSGLDDSASLRRLKGYSKGMRQKVGIAIALAKGAKCLLLDEPSSGLDPAASQELSRLIRSLAETGVATLMATHDLFRAKETCDRIGLLVAGELKQEWNAAEISASDLQASYIDIVGTGVSR